jgi:hypothetical protein
VKRTTYLLPVAIVAVVGWIPVVLAADEAAAGGNAAQEKFDAWSKNSDQQWALLEKYCMECHNNSDYEHSHCSCMT